jgi:hypothetical protein
MTRYCEKCGFGPVRVGPHECSVRKVTDPMTTPSPKLKDDAVERVNYCLGLLAEEMAEATAMIGKALRFGIDTPGPPAPPYSGESARQNLEVELGDAMAAIHFAARHGVVDLGRIVDRSNAKIEKLLNPDSRDNLGRRLAPAPPDRAAIVALSNKDDERHD